MSAPRGPAEQPSIAVYPGSFDPITLGHLDVIGRAAAVFDRVVVALLTNPRKAPMLAEEERLAIIREALDEGLPQDRERVEVASFDGLTVDLARTVGARKTCDEVQRHVDASTDARGGDDVAIIDPAIMLANVDRPIERA